MIRTNLLTLVAVTAFPGLVLTGSAAAQSITALHTLSVPCTPVQSGSLQSGPAAEARGVSGSCTQVCNGVTVISSESEAGWTRYAGCGVLASTTRVSGIQHTAAPCGTPAGGLTNIDQTLVATDVVFSHRTNSAATGFIAQPITMNFEFRGRVLAGASCGPPLVRTTLCAGVGGFCALGGSLTAAGSGSVGSGALIGYPNDGSTVLVTSAAFSAQFNIPASALMQMDAGISSTLCESANPTSTRNVVESVLSLPRSGPVFNLPSDITCNSAQLCIVDNRWVSPAVAAVTSIGSGCTGTNSQQLVLSAVGAPQIGNTAFALAIAGPPAGTLSFVLLGFGLAPSPLQFPGNCFAFLDLTSPLVTVGPVPIAAGTAAFRLPIPFLALHIGLLLHGQGLALDAGMPMGFTTSNALSIRVGS